MSGNLCHYWSFNIFHADLEIKWLHDLSCLNEIPDESWSGDMKKSEDTLLVIKFILSPCQVSTIIRIIIEIIMSKKLLGRITWYTHCTPSILDLEVLHDLNVRFQMLPEPPVKKGLGDHGTFGGVDLFSTPFNPTDTCGDAQRTFMYCMYPLVSSGSSTYIAMDHGPFIDDKHDDLLPRRQPKVPTITPGLVIWVLQIWAILSCRLCFFAQLRGTVLKIHWVWI